jgi:hypothetical protein
VLTTDELDEDEFEAITLLTEGTDDGVTTEADSEDATVLTTLAALLAVCADEFELAPPQAVNKLAKQATPIKQQNSFCTIQTPKILLLIFYQILLCALLRKKDKPYSDLSFY